MVRKLVRIGGALLLLVVLGLGLVVAAVWVLGPPTYDGYEPENFVLQDEGDPIEGKRLTDLLCVRCHFDTDSNALAGRSLGDAYSSLGRPHASNITQDRGRGIGAWSDAQLVMLLRSGVHPVHRELSPPYMPYLPNAADTDLADLVAYLRSGDRWVEPRSVADPRSELGMRALFAAWTSWGPGPKRSSLVLRPEEAEPIALGGYLANDLLQCHGCHSASLDEVDWVSPPDTLGFYEGGARHHDLAGNTIIAPGLTPRQKGGLGGWSYETFRSALVDGVGPGGEVLRWPMPRYGLLREAELQSLYAYFKTLPVAGSAVPTPSPYKVVPKVVDPGRHEFERLGCPSCHAPKAQGYLSLDRIAVSHPEDAGLAAYVTDPRFVDPDAWMPPYGHLLDDAQMSALVEYLRRRAERGPYAPPPKG